MLDVGVSTLKSGFYSYIHMIIWSYMPRERGVARWNPTHVAFRVILCVYVVNFMSYFPIVAPRCHLWHL